MNGNDYDDSCTVCKCKGLAESVSHVDECNAASGIESEYAALDAIISSGVLPFLESHKLKSIMPEEQISCFNANISTQSTLLSVLGTYSNFRNIIHMGYPKGMDTVSLTDISTSLRETGQVGLVICVTVGSGNTEDEYKVSMPSSSAFSVVNRKALLEFLSAVLEGDNNICWYWDCKLKWCAPMLHSNDNNIWVNMVSEAEEPLVEYVGVSGSRTMQCFHSCFKDGKFLTLNTGPAFVLTDPNTSVKPFFASVVRDFVNGAPKDKRCYFCSFLHALHMKKHTKSGVDSVLGTLKLTHALEEALNS